MDRRVLTALLLLIAPLVSASPVNAADSDTATAARAVLAKEWTWTGPDPQSHHDTKGAADDRVRPAPSVPTRGPAGEGSGTCTGQTKTHVVTTYAPVRWESTMPLRCGPWDGQHGWGLRKLVAKGRWNAWYDGMIGATLANPYDRTVNGNSKTYVTKWFEDCTPVYRFKVVVDTRAYGSANPIGIITAYEDYKK